MAKVRGTLMVQPAKLCPTQTLVDFLPTRRNLHRCRKVLVGKKTLLVFCFSLITTDAFDNLEPSMKHK